MVDTYISPPVRGQNLVEEDPSQGQGLKSQLIQSRFSMIHFILQLVYDSLPASYFPSRVKVLYDYEAQDLDELTIKEGELIDLVKEGCNLHLLKNFFSDSFLLRWEWVVDGKGGR